MSGPELMRQLHVEQHGEEDPHVAAALELRRRWRSVHSELDSGGTLCLEKEGVTSSPVNTVIILWRQLDYDTSYDWKIVKSCLADRHTPIMGEQWDWLVAYLDGDTIRFMPHALNLLATYELPPEVS